MLEYFNPLRAGTRLRPIMMTTLAATLCPLLAALSRGIAIVIVGGLMTAMMNIFLPPALYAWIAWSGDRLPVPEADFQEQE